MGADVAVPVAARPSVEHQAEEKDDAPPSSDSGSGVVAQSPTHSSSCSGGINDGPGGVDVVVIGAGAAGLSAVRTLLRASSPPSPPSPSTTAGTDSTAGTAVINSITILEALPHIGGRIKSTSRFLPGGRHHVDLGAEIIHGFGTVLTDVVEENREEWEGRIEKYYGSCADGPGRGCGKDSDECGGPENGPGELQHGERAEDDRDRTDCCYDAGCPDGSGCGTDERGTEGEQNESRQSRLLEEIFIAAQGDGGPQDRPTRDGKYGVYYLPEEDKLLRFDTDDVDFQRMSQVLADVAEFDLMSSASSDEEDDGADADDAYDRNEKDNEVDNGDEHDKRRGDDEISPREEADVPLRREAVALVGSDNDGDDDSDDDDGDGSIQLASLSFLRHDAAQRTGPAGNSDRDSSSSMAAAETTAAAAAATTTEEEAAASPFGGSPGSRRPSARRRSSAISLGHHLSLESNAIPRRMSGLLSAGYANTAGCTDLSQVSLQATVSYEKHWEENEIEGDARLHPLIGMVGIVEVMGDEIGRDGRVAVKLNWEAARIDWSESENDADNANGSENGRDDHDGGRGRIAITSTDGAVLQADKVIVSVPPPIITSQKLKFNPSLPETKMDAFSMMGMDRAIKVILQFKERVWPEKVQTVITADMAMPEIWFRDFDYWDDNELRRGQTKTVHAAVCFLTSDAANNLLKTIDESLQLESNNLGQNLSMEQRRAEIAASIAKDQLSQIFSVDLNHVEQKYVSSIIYDWGEVPTICGGYSYPKVDIEKHHFTDMAESLGGKLYFAGEATNTGAACTVQAAIETGIRAALEILEQLGETNGGDFGAAGRDEKTRVEV